MTAPQRNRDRATALAAQLHNLKPRYGDRARSGPYWLNGMVSLVAQLNATGDSAAFLAGEKDAALEVDVNAQVNSWIACAAPAAHSTAPIDRHAAGSSTRRP